MSEDWTHIRVSRTTLALLEQQRASMELGESQGQRELVRDDRGRVSLSQIVAELCYMRERHLGRVRRSNTRRKDHRAILPPPPAEASGGGSQSLGKRKQPNSPSEIGWIKP